jgi:uncharacterized protein (DUF2164 family)
MTFVDNVDVPKINMMQYLLFISKKLGPTSNNCGCLVGKITAFLFKITRKTLDFFPKKG